MKIKYTLLIIILQMQPVYCKTEKLLSEYERNLAIIYFAYSDVKLMEEICAKHHPQFKEQNSKAYSDWELKYLDYLNEINLHWRNFIFEKSIGKNGEIDLELYTDNMKDLNQIIEEGKTNKEKFILKNHGNQRIEVVCKAYPSVYLKLEESNIEFYFKKETKIIRKKKRFFY